MKYVLPISLCFVLLTGCLYPNEELVQNQIPHEDQIQMVQHAVDQYVEANDGRVPIVTKPAETPIFEKYIIDFDLLKNAGLLSSIPGNAFENGGIYKYVLITPEENPQVKLIDLRLSDQLRTLNFQLQQYRNKYIYPPFGDRITNGVHLINYEELGLKEPPTVTSPYSQTNLPIIMDTTGQIHIDYRIDLHQALQEYDHNYEPGDDIRYILAENTPFVPSYSLPYTIENDEPIFLIEN